MHPTETTLGVLLLVENEHPWWSLILFRYPALDRRPTPKFHYAMFSQELIWSEEIYYTKIVVLNIRSEDTSLRSDVLHCVSHSVIRQHFFNLNKRNLSHEPRGSRAFHLSWRAIEKSTSRQTIPKIGYLCMLISSELYSIVTYFRKINSMPTVTLAHAQ